MVFRFGTFAFDDRTALRTRAERPVALEPQPARALALLFARAGEVVSGDELRAHLWSGDTHVDFDRGLAYCIGELRAALGDSADDPRFVQTLPRAALLAVAMGAAWFMVRPNEVPVGKHGARKFVNLH
jgi:DNA-binding winged helix-turn-helix (wHTH) protein